MYMNNRILLRCISSIQATAQLLFVLAVAVPTVAIAQGTPAPPDAAAAAASPASPADEAPLNLVVAKVKQALDQYQQSLGKGTDALPPLSSATFGFKATTATTIGGSINLFIFKIGGSHESDVVHDVSYTYSVPSPPAIKKEAAPPLTEDLVKTIKGAAAAAKTAAELGKLKLTKIAVNIQYGVKWDGNVGANVPISIVTIGINADKNKNTVQSLGLVFGK
jgi:hypothetical protein